MNENAKKRRYRIKGKGLAVISHTPEAVINGCEPHIRKHIARTLGMMSDFGHPDVEVFYKFSEEPYRYPLLDLIHGNVKNGICYKEGDRLGFKAGFYNDDYTVEFRSVTVNGENLLRAVVLELDEEYQSLPSEEAVEVVCSLCEGECSQGEIDLFDIE